MKNQQPNDGVLRRITGQNPRMGSTLGNVLETDSDGDRILNNTFRDRFSFSSLRDRNDMSRLPTISPYFNAPACAEAAAENFPS